MKRWKYVFVYEYYLCYIIITCLYFRFATLIFRYASQMSVDKIQQLVYKVILHLETRKINVIRWLGGKREKMLHV